MNTNADIIAKNVISLMKESGITTPTELARRSGLNQPTVHRILKGESLDPKLSNLKALAKALDAHYWQLTEDYETSGVSEESKPEFEKFVNISFLDIELAAGSGFCGAQESTQDLIPISKDWIFENSYSEASLKAVTVRGDSMSPRIQDGDVLLINTADSKPNSGNVYAIAVDDELRVKRLVKRMDGSWIISSDNKTNPAYVDETISHHNFEKLRIIGRAVKVLMGDL